MGGVAEEEKEDMCGEVQGMTEEGGGDESISIDSHALLKRM